MKKLLCLCCCFALVFLWICPAFATSEQPDEFGNGLLPMDEEVLFAHLAENEGSQIQLLETLPSSVDLSASPYFPPIKSQEMLYSDVAFSTTYYQFTYEKNKYHQVASANSATWATPKWTYNVLNGGENQPIAFNKAYDFLQTQGALSWAQFPYQGGGSSSGQVSPNLYRDWPTNKEHMRNALKTRLTNWASRYISGTGTVITSATDTDLNVVKRALNNGKVLQVGSHNNWNEWILPDGKIISYRCYDDESGNPGHSMVIVGYDDNVTCDVNDNGVIESAERGAFKVANCWGTEENNDGYLWVMYDALNAVSAIPGNDISEPYDIRVPAFAYGTTDNWFTSIDVEDKEVYYVAELTINTPKKSRISYELKKYDAAGGVTGTAQTPYNANGGGYSYSGTFVNDFSNCAIPIPNNTAGYRWGFELRSYSYDTTLSGLDFKIVDSLGKVIKNYGSVPSITGGLRQVSMPINLALGDVDYDGSVDSSDAMSVLNYNVGKEKFSDLQLYLADYDGNGVIDATDAQGILSHS